MTDEILGNPSEDLPAFSGDQPRCKKCGHDQAGTSYEREGLNEWLERECGRCGYSWNEAVLEPGQVQTFEIAGVQGRWLSD